MPKSTGRVRWFNRQKGHEILEHEDGLDVFCHRKALECDWTRGLRGGDLVEYDLELSPKKSPRRSRTPNHQAT